MKQRISIRVPKGMVERAERLTLTGSPVLTARYGSGEGCINRTDVMIEALLVGLQMLEQGTTPPAHEHVQQGQP